MSDTNDDRDRDGAQRERSVKTPLEDTKHGAALAANLRPDTAEVVHASVTHDGQLELTLRGDPVA